MEEEVTVVLTMAEVERIICLAAQAVARKKFANNKRMAELDEIIHKKFFRLKLEKSFEDANRAEAD